MEKVLINVINRQLIIAGKKCLQPRVESLNVYNIHKAPTNQLNRKPNTIQTWTNTGKKNRCKDRSKSVSLCGRQNFKLATMILAPGVSPMLTLHLQDKESLQILLTVLSSEP